MVAQVAVTAVARAGAAGARAAAGVTVRAVKVGGRAAASGARAGAQAGGRAAASGARNGARAGGRAAAGGARAGGRSATAGARRGGEAAGHGASGPPGARPGGALRPPWGPGRAQAPPTGSSAGTGPASPGPPAGASLDAAPRTAGAVRGASRTLGRIARPLVRRRGRRMLRGQAGKAKERQKRHMRRLRRVALVLALVLAVMATTTFVAANVGQGSDGPGGGGMFAAVDGIPFAEVFNELAALGIDPRLVAAVAWAESSFDPAVISCQKVSADGAKGVMQLMPEAAREVGADPCDPAEAIPGGARYLLTQKARFGTWELALAAYNAGPQTVADSGGIPPRAETQKYVPEVMAKWDEYRRQFPAESVGGAPGSPLGSTARYAERGLRPQTQRLLDAVIPMFGRGHGVGCIGERSGPSEHPLGRACDFMMSNPANRMPTAEYLQHGWAMAKWMVANAEAYDVYYVIWQERIWSSSYPDAGWRPYTRYPNGNLTEKHYDHIHVSLLA